MLNARQQRELLLHDPHRQPPALFGKPWFWQRSSGVMEGTRSLARVIMEMQEEIRKLEAQNPVLPKEEGDREQEQTLSLCSCSPDNVIMTVRRYSMNSSPPDVTQSEGTADLGGQLSHSGWGLLQEEVRGGNGNLDHSVTSDVGSARNKTSLQEYVHKTRAKAKTVTFLLPVDDIYNNKPVLPELAPVTDTESHRL